MASVIEIFLQTCLREIIKYQMMIMMMQS